MKKQWMEPRILVQAFAPNEYVSTCWKVACSNNTTKDHQQSNAPYGDLWSNPEGPYDNPFSHEGDCSKAENNYFSVNANNDIVFEFEKSSEQGNLTGGYDAWVDVNENDKVDTGDVIYWFTQNLVRVWNHWGYVQSVDQAHINRS